MNAVSIISVCFGGISLLVSVIVFIRTIHRESRKDWEAHNQAKDDIKASLLKLDLTTEIINNTTSDIKTDIKNMTKSISDMDGRLVRVELEHKAIQKEFDEIKEKVYG